VDAEAFRSKLGAWRASQGGQLMQAYWQAIPLQTQASMDFEGDAIALEVLEAQLAEL
jgi:hypothetical protein